MKESGLSISQVACIIRILWRECITEIRVEHPAIRVFVIPSQECVDIILVAKNSKLLKSFMKLRRSYPPLGLLIKQLEAIVEIEFTCLGQPYLGVFEFALVIDDLLENCDKLILFVVI